MNGTSAGAHMSPVPGRCAAFMSSAENAAAIISRTARSPAGAV
uniref:Uncharacterized protein n=1 Tax=Myoviridae sp. ctp7F23 TaxID=2825174 RepID=A0A8S5U8P1_9CAUD|nr:MAG TPA: hypothetical protein [Myoviridae sp. ctp7F23]